MRSHADKPVIDVETLIQRGLDPIPLYRSGHVDKRGRNRGKSPLHNSWRRRDYSLDELKAAVENGHNIGIRLRENQLVVDVDPRNFENGDELERFVMDFGIDLDERPTTETPSGGMHIFLRKPPEACVRNDIKGYPGIELKSSGRQTVTPGSIHPDHRMGPPYRAIAGVDDAFDDVWYSSLSTPSCGTCFSWIGIHCISRTRERTHR